MTENVRDWFRKHGLDTQDPRKQWFKLIEEYGELVEGVNKDNRDLVLDALGDLQVVLIGMDLQLGLVYNFDSTYQYHPQYDIWDTVENLHDNLGYLSRKQTGAFYRTMEDIYNICRIYDTSLDETLGIAYNEIKDRVVKLHNGQLIKESDWV